MVVCQIDIAKPCLSKKTVKCCNFKAINQVQFKSDLCSNLYNLPSDCTCEQYLNEFDDMLCSIMNNHAPEETKYRTIRPRYPWYNADIREQRKLRRRLERKWRKHGLLEDKQAYLEQRVHVNKLIERAKVEFYHEKLVNYDAKGISQTVNTLLNRTGKTLPSCDSTQNLCNKFADVFETKVAKIRKDLDKDNSFNSSEEVTSFANETCISSPVDFESVSVDEIRKLVSLSVQLNHASLIPYLPGCLKITWTLLYRTSLLWSTCLLSQGVFQKPLGQAIISPILKKLSLDCNELANYRPVSN